MRDDIVSGHGPPRGVPHGEPPPRDVELRAMCGQRWALASRSRQSRRDRGGVGRSPVMSTAGFHVFGACTHVLPGKDRVRLAREDRGGTGVRVGVPASVSRMVLSLVSGLGRLFGERRLVPGRRRELTPTARSRQCPRPGSWSRPRPGTRPRPQSRAAADARGRPPREGAVARPSSHATSCCDDTIRAGCRHSRASASGGWLARVFRSSASARSPCAAGTARPGRTGAREPRAARAVTGTARGTRPRSVVAVLPAGRA
ncbi:hypothetical protein EES42_35505 [Streptomyces sp. ADI95-17]|nr:hypothetical protein EES42_35505 [Streptomyces sp. ADI95-17]